MRLTKEELLALYQPSRGQSERAECPTPEELALAATEGMAKAERQRLTAHLTLCSDCAEEFRFVLPLETFAKDAAASLPGAAPATLRDSVRAAAPSLVGNWWQSLADLFFPLRPAHAMAATFLLISIVLGVWLASIRRQHQSEVARLNNELAQKDQATASSNQALEDAQRELQETIRRYEQEGSPARAKQYEEQIAELRRSIDELSRPQINTPIVNLEPQGSLRNQSQSGARIIELPAGANSYLLVLNVTGEQSHTGYDLDIEDLNGKVVRRINGLHKTPHNTFTVVLSRQLFPAGAYQFRLYGIDSGKRKLVEDYTVRIRYR